MSYADTLTPVQPNNFDQQGMGNPQIGYNSSPGHYSRPDFEQASLKKLFESDFTTDTVEQQKQAEETWNLDQDEVVDDALFEKINDEAYQDEAPRYSTERREVVAEAHVSQGESIITLEQAGQLARNPEANLPRLTHIGDSLVMKRQTEISR